MDRSRLALSVLVLLALGLALGGGGKGCTIGKEPSPFKAEKLTVAVIHDGGNTTNLPLWANNTDERSVDAFVKGKGGEFRIIEQKSDMTNAADKWKAAMKVERKSVPWIVAADASTGFSQPATTEVEALAALAKMGSK